MKFPKFLTNIEEVTIQKFLGETGIGKTYGEPFTAKPSKLDFRNVRYMGSNGQLQVAAGIALFTGRTNIAQGDKLIVNSVTYIVVKANTASILRSESGIEVVFSEQ